MYTLKYNFEDRHCKNFNDLLEEIKNIPNNKCFSIVDKRASMHSVVYLDKKEDKLFESYGQEKLFDVDSLKEKSA